jgi:hypothetical protein
MLVIIVETGNWCLWQLLLDAKLGDQYGWLVANSPVDLLLTEIM